MRRAAVLAGALLLLLVTAASPVQADPPERVDEPYFMVFPDFEHGVVAFWNISRDDFCDWTESEVPSPPPVVEWVTVQVIETGQEKDALVMSAHATRPLELWTLEGDSGLPPFEQHPACLDTDDSPGPWATGDVKVNFSDNDFEVSGTRTNSFGDRGRGTVVDGDNARWHYSWTFRAHCLVDCEVDFSVQAQNFNLKKMG